MSINLSDLTSPNNQEVLAQITSGADFLDPIGKLKNLSRSPNSGSDALQTVALNQPRALPLIDGDGYLYLSGVSGNRATLSETILPATGDFDLTIDFVWKDTGVANQDLFGQYTPSIAGRFFIYVTPAGELRVFWNGAFGHDGGASGSIIEGRRHSARFNRTGNTFTIYLDGVSYYSATVGSTVPILEVGSTLGFAGTRFVHTFKGAMFSVTEGSNTNIDFTATNVRHGDTKFKCATGQVVTINQSGNDPSTIIKRPVLRFANTGSTNISLRGLFANNINGGYMFAAFSVLGNGGESNGRTFTINQDSYGDFQLGGAIFGYQPSAGNLRAYSGGIVKDHTGLFDDTNADILHEAKITNGNQLSKVNNADLGTTSITYVVNSNKFNIAANENDARSYGENTALDLEYLALFPASITDAQADSVRNYINNRNNVFLRHDTDGYYFFDPLSLAADAPVSSWNGQIVGSDNDANLTITQSTANSQPDRLAPDKDGMVVRFNDSNDHLIVPSSFVEPAAGSWQVVGTSLGTFAYRVNANAVTELNLLGNAGNASYRKAGDLYGVILLPETATGADIEAARRLLIDRGAADASTIISVQAAWFRRYDIVEFKNAEFPDAVTLGFAFEEATNLSKISTVNAPICSNFSSAWKDCTALTSFPAGAKLGTSANNVNFTRAWQSSGLTSIPALDLSKGVNFLSAFLSSDISSIDPNLLLGTAATSAIVDFTNIFNDCQNLTEVPVSLDLSKGDKFQQSFRNCASLVDFAPNIFDSIGTPLNSCFNNTWQGTVSLNDVSVENILVSIDTSGQSAPSTEPQITIDYNTATGSLSAATNSAVTSLKSKGWSIIVNNVTL